MARSPSLGFFGYGGLFMAVLFSTSCVRYEDNGSGRLTRVPAKPPPSAPTSAASAADATKLEGKDQSKKTKAAAKTTFDIAHDEEIKTIFGLAGKGEWEAAEARADALAQSSPQDPAAQRLASWVKQQRQMKRSQALEDKIREIDAKNSVFNPSLKNVFTEQKDRGLPPRKDVRDAIEQINSARLIPENYGKTNILRPLIFELESTQGRMAKVLEKKISVHLDNAQLESIIFNIGQAEGINFVADKSLPAFKQTLSLNLDQVKLSEFLSYLSRNLDLQFQVGDDLIWVVDAKDQKRVQEETRVYRLKKGFVLPAQLGPPEVVRTQATVNNVTTVTEVQKMAKFVNDLAPPIPAIALAVTNFFTGKFQIDYEHNLIVARGTREQLEVIDKIVQEFDKPLQQVLIEARFLTISEAAFLKLGIAWESGRPLASGSTLNAATGLGQTFSGLGLGEIGLGLQETRSAILSRQGLSATLTALQQSGESHILSAPRLTVVNNLPATITDGTVQYYYDEYQVKQEILVNRATSSLVPSGKPVPLNAGVTLTVLASIGGDGKTILLALNPKVNSNVQFQTFATIKDLDAAGNVVSSFDINLPISRTQELATRMVVGSGETVVMGGVLERQQTRFVESVPVLGSLPIIGAAFRRRTELDMPRYLLIFVTATVVSESGEFVVREGDREGSEAQPEKK